MKICCSYMIMFEYSMQCMLIDLPVEELPDYSNSYFVESQKNYLVELNSLSVPKGFEDFDSEYTVYITLTQNYNHL